MATLGGTSTSAGPRDTLFISPIPLTTTAEDIDHFFGMMVDSYMERDKDGVLTSRCYVQFEDETLAQEALKKNNQFLIGCSVQVCRTSVTLESLRKKKQCSAIRVLPFKINYETTNVIPDINRWYPNLLSDNMISNVDWLTDGEDPYEHMTAFITFKDSSIAELVMKNYEEMLEKSPIAASKAQTDQEIRDHMDKCQKQMFWWEP